MTTCKTLKLIGLGLSVLGAGIGIVGGYVSDKRQSLEMSEKIDLAVNQKLMEMEMSNPEKEIKEEL